MVSKIEQLQKENECIERRYQRAEKGNNMTEIYAARYDYQTNIEKQKDEIKKLEKTSDEYCKAETSIKEQETKAFNMRYQNKEGTQLYETRDHLTRLQNENRDLSNQMDRAVEKADTRKYDELRQRYTTNVKAQEGISDELSVNGIEHENTTEKQKIDRQNLDIDMRNKMEEKVDKAKKSGKEPSERDTENLKKYQQNVRDDERQAIEEIDKKKIEQMESYGVSEETIEKEKARMEQARNRLLGEEINQ